jgi:hypothetical protein
MNQLEEGHLREREAEKQDAIAALEEALASIEQQHREPDEWERVHFVHGLASLFFLVLTPLRPVRPISPGHHQSNEARQ